MNLLRLLAPITTFVFDVDGVLTDGTLLLFPDGNMIRRMNIKDGYALQLAIKQGYNIAIISGGYSEPVKDRFVKLGVTDIFMEVNDKKKILTEYIANRNIQWHEILIMGDDIPDVEMMQQPGVVACCPADAVDKIKQISHYISPFSGGSGCVRDVVEKVMKIQNTWKHVKDVKSK